MDDPRPEPGMPVLDRQPMATAVGAVAGRAVPPRAVPETRPTPLQRHYVNLSAVALVAGVVAITALETGSTMASPLVRLCVLVASPILVLTTADACLRIWRSARTWLPVDRGRALFRLAWLAAGGLGIVVFAAAGVAAILA
jgi:hypothetical protein